MSHTVTPQLDTEKLLRIHGRGRDDGTYESDGGYDSIRSWKGIAGRRIFGIRVTQRWISIGCQSAILHSNTVVGDARFVPQQSSYY
jgi:hypothetical protein